MRLQFFVFLILMFSLVTKTYAYAGDTYPFTFKKEAERFRTLTQEMRCVVCQNQSLAESDAPLARDLRKKIYVMLKEKKSNTEIKKYLVERYGEFILLQPPFNKITFVLWAFPFAALIFIFLVTIQRIPLP